MLIDKAGARRVPS